MNKRKEESWGVRSRWETDKRKEEGRGVVRRRVGGWETGAETPAVTTPLPVRHLCPAEGAFPPL